MIGDGWRQLERLNKWNRLDDHLRHTIFHIPATLLLSIAVSVFSQTAGVCVLLYMVFIGTWLHSHIYQEIMEKRREKKSPPNPFHPSP